MHHFGLDLCGRAGRVETAARSATAASTRAVAKQASTAGLSGMPAINAFRAAALESATSTFRPVGRRATRGGCRPGNRARLPRRGRPLGDVEHVGKRPVSDRNEIVPLVPISLPAISSAAFEAAACPSR
ncbi:hypothetical protein F2981_22780 (plasmid) [Sinorhizobium meliloti]|nr:hypothetical protein [Sinorhizobium meliloti]